MVSWKDDLRRVVIGGRTLIGASFRGVPFFVDASERGGGRRNVIHEFPLSDKPFAEDLGQRARTFRVDGYVCGDDYLTQRDALLDALEAEGPGQLVHPYHGLRVVVLSGPFSQRESRQEGGYASFALEFTETPTQAPTPSVVANPPDLVATAADAANAATDAELAEKYSTSGLPAFALASAEASLTKAADALKDKLAPIVSATQEAAQLTGQLALLTAEASSLVRAPSDVMQAFRTALTGLVDTALAAPGAVMNAFIDTYSADLGELIAATTSTRARERDNQVALQGALRRTLACEAARLAPLVAYVSIEEATLARDAVAAMLEQEAAGAGDTAYPALVELRSQVLRAVPGGASFARIVTVTRAVPIPSLLLAYQLYGSVDLEPDLVARNGIRHPGFVAGDLKVLSDG